MRLRIRIAWIPVLTVCLLLGLAPAGAQAASEDESFQPPPGALIAPGKAPDLFLLYTGDVLGYVDACG